MRARIEGSFSFYSCSFCLYKGLGAVVYNCSHSLYLSRQMRCSHLAEFSNSPLRTSPITRQLFSLLFLI